MTRPIKFRGRGIDGEFYFGDVYHAGKRVGIHVRGEGIFEADPDSIAQLVGYDANGREVYEGDVIVDQDGGEMPAMMFAIQFDGKLKEAVQ